MLLALVSGALQAADAAAPAEQPAVAAPEKAQPQPVPLAEAAGRAEATAATLRYLQGDLAPNGAVSAIANELPALTREIDARAKESAKIIGQRPSLEVLRTLERARQWSIGGRPR